MKGLLLAAAALLSVSSGADAAANLISAKVEGLTAADGTPTITIWDTDKTDSHYKLFLYQPVFSPTALNSPDPTINDPTANGLNLFVGRGDGYPGNTTTDSDDYYKLTLGFAGGTVISGVYDALHKSFLGGTSSNGYTLDGFFWERTRRDTVSQAIASQGNDTRDYLGGFAFTAVPEPSTWAMMLGGFFMLGAVMRRRARVAVSYA